MGLRLVQVNLKAHDDTAVGGFWAQALGWHAVSGEPGATSVRPPGASWPDPDAVWLDVIAVADTGTVRDRAHLELATSSSAHRTALLARLEELGAATLGPAGQDLPRTVLADPEGNVFCVREPEDSGRGPVAAVVVDCADPRVLARFWAEAVGWTVLEVSDGRALLRAAAGAAPDLELVRTPHVPGTWHRAHLDLLPEPVEDQAAEVARLEALGAAPADVGQGAVPWKVLADPEGHAFCVLGRG